MGGGLRGITASPAFRRCRGLFLEGKTFYGHGAGIGVGIGVGDGFG
jgi:hypothetical protein